MDNLQLEAYINKDVAQLINILKLVDMRGSNIGVGQAQ
jgi:hypothetical protein